MRSSDIQYNGMAVYYNMAYLHRLALSGFRKFPPKEFQIVQFGKRMTLIGGDNGSGKSTIIDVLKYLATGTLPARSDWGKSFIMHPGIVGKAQLVAQGRLEFVGLDQETVLACRLATSAQKGEKVCFQTRKCTLTRKRQGQERETMVLGPAEMDKEMQQQLGVPKLVMEEIIFCRSEDAQAIITENGLRGFLNQAFNKKRYSQIIEGYKEAAKDYLEKAKSIKESKEFKYSKRIYDEVNNIKMSALRQTRLMAQQTVELSLIRRKIESLGPKTDSTVIMHRNTKRLEKMALMEKRQEEINVTATKLKEKIKSSILYCERQGSRLIIFGKNKQQLIEDQRKLKEEFRRRHQDSYSLRLSQQQSRENNRHISLIGTAIQAFEAGITLLDFEEGLASISGDIAVDKKKIQQDTAEVKRLQALEHQRVQLEQQFKTKKQEIDLKADVAYNKGQVPFADDYIFKASEVSCLQAAAKDLQALSLSVLAATTQFKKNKINAANKIIAEMWMSVCSGQGMIQVCQEVENSSKFSVVVQDGGKKLNIKGQFSEGQRALACIVLRIAFLQVFAKHARIFTLDDPTANMDRKHKMALAKLLSQMMKNGFQIVVASRDRTFLRILSKDADQYHVVRCDQKGYSCISIMDVRKIEEDDEHEDYEDYNDGQ